MYGGVTCNAGDTCTLKTTEMGSNGGFYGKYGAPTLVENAAKKLLLRNRLLSSEGGRILRTLDEDYQEYYESDSDIEENVVRELANTELDYTKSALRNTVICITKGDSMIITIRYPKQYPDYLKDSVMNSNPSFDYGAYLILAD